MRLCIEHGIKLIEIPYRSNNNTLPADIEKLVLDLGYNPTRLANKIRIDHFTIYNRYAKEHERLQSIAISKGGLLLSSNYKGNATKLRWRCANGHEWKTTPNAVSSQGQWCPKCAGTKKLTIEEMQDIAKSRGGLCLSKHYTNIKTKLIWQCSNGHKWLATPKAIKNGTWCPECARIKKKSIY